MAWHGMLRVLLPILIGMVLVNEPCEETRSSSSWMFRPLPCPPNTRPVPKLLHAFTFTPVGELSTDWSAYIQRGTLAAPLPFKCDIKPRSAALAAAIRQEYEGVRPFLEKFDPEG